MGERIKVEEILSWTGSRLIKGDISKKIFSISTDTRTLKIGDFFIPLTGQNYDGHFFISEALKKKASGFVYESGKKEYVDSELKKVNPDSNDILIFQTEDNLEFLKLVARGYMRKYRPTVIGITGSNGKTTTKNFLVSIISRKYNTRFTPGNYNNEIGVSKSILSIDRSTRFFVAELGMRGKGQIRALSDICNVNIGVITNVAESHLEFFGSLEEIAYAKAEIAEMIRENEGVLFLNSDNEWTTLIKSVVSCDILEFGSKRNGGTNYSFKEKSVDRFGRFTFDFFEGEKRIAEISLGIPGYHNIYNACGAASVCRYLDIDPADVKEGIESSSCESLRMEIIKRDGKTIINDSYNANPVSVKSAIDTLCVISRMNRGRSVAILGDMLELGEDSVRLHREIGKYLSEKSVDVLIACGKLAFYFCEGYLKPLKGSHSSLGKVSTGSEVSNGNKLNIYNSGESEPTKGLCFYFKNKEELGKKLKNLIKPGDFILLKGSRANKMEEIVAFI
ncbi:MAG: UDP-N-acetylmuramoyl-tripeptide--D-alanyl-D-alanine ligase [Actinobacteria bacterium]|nr:UDP-N-acetylmuramoyl-tripeptide--D-alanyl-D-alanine ligase [Actinomycetota bacterium]